MFKFQLLWFVVFSIHLLSAQERKVSLKRLLYKTHKVQSAIKIDGNMDEEDWKNAETRTLDYFYFTEKGHEQKTTYRMLWDEQNIYLFFQCEDKYLNASETKRDGAPYLDDCVEFFVTPAPTVADMHFCFEMNINKSMNDIVFVNNFYGEEPTVVKQYNPEVHLEVKINGTLNDNSDIDKGWNAEIAIPHNAFFGSTRLFPVQKGNKWSFIAIRKNRDKLVEKGERSAASLFPMDNLIKGRDVHNPEMFGLLEFVD